MPRANKSGCWKHGKQEEDFSHELRSRRAIKYLIFSASPARSNGIRSVVLTSAVFFDEEGLIGGDFNAMTNDIERRRQVVSWRNNKEKAEKKTICTSGRGIFRGFTLGIEPWEELSIGNCAVDLIARVQVAPFHWFPTQRFFKPANRRKTFPCLLWAGKTKRLLTSRELFGIRRKVDNDPISTSLCAAQLGNDSSWLVSGNQTSTAVTVKRRRQPWSSFLVCV